MFNADSPGPKIVVRLYVAPSSVASMSAEHNLNAVAAALRQSDPAIELEIEIMDVLKNPLQALTDRVLITPTLVRRFPLPELRIMGSLTDISDVMRLLLSQ